MWTCSLNSAREPFRPVQNHTWKYCADAHISFGVRAWKKRGENENQNVHLLFFTWHLLSNALQMTVCFSMAFFICLFIRPSVRTYHITPELCALCAMLSNVCTPTACVLVYFCYVVCNYRSQINQYKANNRIVYIIYLSGMIQQVHLCALSIHIESLPLPVMVIVIISHFRMRSEAQQRLHFSFRVRCYLCWERNDFDHENWCGVKNHVDTVIEWPFFSSPSK